MERNAAGKQRESLGSALNDSGVDTQENSRPNERTDEKRRRVFPETEGDASRMKQTSEGASKGRVRRKQQYQQPEGVKHRPLAGECI